MQLCENLTQADKERIGRQIAEAFLAESGAFTVLPQDAANRLFSLIVDTCYQTGHLYTTSEKQEGFCVYWTKEERPGLLVQLKMARKMATCMPLKASFELGKNQSNWTPTEKRYKKRNDFVEVFLIAVRKEYQGQGFFRKMLQEPFELAEQRHTICVLDTDSRMKADKYCHVGMHVVDSSLQRGGITMYALEK